jgi:uncharacterized protein YjbI with pentapeptide repeats
MQILNRYTGTVILEIETLTGANLTGVNLTGVNLTDADLRGADLRGANLTDANLTDADLRGANLRGANQTDANLRGANLTRANLRGADLDYSCWPLQCSSLRAITDNCIAAQLLYHAFAVSSINPTEEQIKFMSDNFHRFTECGGVETIVHEEVTQPV